MFFSVEVMILLLSQLRVQMVMLYEGSEARDEFDGRPGFGDRMLI